jgi:hypothetical protein
MERRPPAGFGEEHLQRMQAFLESRGVELTCPICDGNEFAIEGVVHWPEVTYGLGGPATTGANMAVVVITCQNCAHSMTFNAYKMEVLEG